MRTYFGTDGVRGPVNEVLTMKIAYRIGRYLGQPNSEGNGKKILIGMDTRASGEALLAALATGIMASGSSVYATGITTTPSISYLTRKHGFDHGIMISASHNPFYDNGIKVFNSIGEKLESEIERDIERYIERIEDTLPFAFNENIGRYIDARDLVDEYIDFLYEKGQELQNLKIIVDCANGSASFIAPKLFAKFNIDATFINNEPDGLNINLNCGSTHLGALQTEIKKGGYDLGLAFDGDADRLLVVKPDGAVVDGDAIIYLNALNMRKRGKLKDNKVVLTIMSNYGTKVSLEKQGLYIEETDVGDKYVQARLKEKELSLGGEQSGHVIFLADLNTGDGLLTAIKVLKTIHFENQTIDQLLKDLTIYPQKLSNVRVSNKAAVMSNPPLLKRIKEVNTELAGRGRVLVRPSGTEQLIRVMAEAPTQQECDQIVSDFALYIQNLGF